MTEVQSLIERLERVKWALFNGEERDWKDGEAILTEAATTLRTLSAERDSWKERAEAAEAALAYKQSSLSAMTDAACASMDDLSTSLQRCITAEGALAKVRDLANGRDSLDGFPRSIDEKQRRLAAIYEAACAIVGMDGTVSARSLVQP